MNLNSSTVFCTAALAVFCANTAFGQSAGAGLAAGTEYELLGTDSVSFSPGIQNKSRKALLFKLSVSGGSVSGGSASNGSAATEAATGADKLSADASAITSAIISATGNEPADELKSDAATVWSGDLAFDRIDFLKPGEVRMYDLTDGLSYSASIDVEKTDEFDSQSEIISSRQLGIHYGRLGSENYSSVDLSFRHINEEAAESTVEETEDQELWSLGVTTGRRFALTGLDPTDPLWTVSLRGQFNVIETDTLDEALENQQWYVSPGLQWSHDSFRLTADVLMPFMQSGELEEESDYRVRAKIQKQF